MIFSPGAWLVRQCSRRIFLTCVIRMYPGMRTSQIMETIANSDLSVTCGYVDVSWCL